MVSDVAYDQPFTEQKDLFTTDPILVYFHLSRCIVVETDASDFVKGAILSQYGDDRMRHPVAYYSQIFTPGEIS